MSDGLSFLFDLDAKLDGLNAAVSSMEKLRDRMSAADGNARRLAQAMEGTDWAFVRANEALRANAKEAGLSSQKTEELAKILFDKRGESFASRVGREFDSADRPVKKASNAVEEFKGEAVELDDVLYSLRIEQLTSGAKATSVATKEMTRDISGVTQELHKLGTFVKGLTIFAALKMGFESLHRMAERFGEKISETINVAANADRLSFAFRGVFGGRASEYEAWAEKFARASELTEGASKLMTVGLGRVGLRGEALTRAASAASDLAAMTGNPEEGMSSAVASIEKIFRTGRIDNRALGIFGFNSKMVAEEISAATGKSAKSIAKGLKSGEGDVEMSLETLYTMIGKKTQGKLGDLGYQASNTLGARLKKLRDLPEQFMERFKDTRAFGALNEAIGRILERFDPDGPGGRRIMAFIDRIANKFSTWIENLDVDSLMDKAEGALKMVMSAGEAIATAFKPVLYLLSEAADKLEIIQGLASGKTYDQIMVERVKRNFEKTNGVSMDKWGGGGVFNRTAFYDTRESFGPEAAPSWLTPKRARANAEGGIVVGVAGGLAVVRPASGEGMASVGPGEAIVPRGGGSPHITINLTIPVSGGMMQPSDANALGQVIKGMLPGAIADAMEMVALRAGA